MMKTAEIGHVNKVVSEPGYSKQWQKTKLLEPLAEAKPVGMKAEDWTLLDRQALGVVRLSLVKNVAYNVVKEKTAYALIKALSNMCEKPSASNKALLLLSSLPESWPSTVTTVSGLTGTTKLTFDNICDLIIWKDIRRKTSGEYSNSLNHCSMLVASKDKDVNMTSDDALVCCIENTIEDQIMDSGASFHSTYFKEELERFSLCSGKVCLADDKTLDITGIRDVGLKTSFGTCWTLKDVSLVVAHGNKRESLYMVEVPSNGINVTIDGTGNATLWHQRLGHMSEKGIEILASKVSSFRDFAARTAGEY
ncbi:hypothetical protein Tco_1547425 [Tanacetum coccineum]